MRPRRSRGANHRRINVVDSHTGGEPTRVVLDGFPRLEGSTPVEQRDALRHARYGQLRRMIVDEPRGNEAMVAALLVEPSVADAVAAAVFFDRSAVLGMCGHGTIGLIETLRFQGRIGPGRHKVETPVGLVTADLDADGSITLKNVNSRRLLAGVTVEVPGLGPVVGDIAYGGNTFFLVKSPQIDLDQSPHSLILTAQAILDASHCSSYGDVDHVEVFGPPTRSPANSRSFVLCPSETYDRSPCGTGTSAKIACLAADGMLDPGETWTQESITGSTFVARYEWVDRASGTIAPTITGRAEVVSEATLLFDEADPAIEGLS